MDLSDRAPPPAEGPGRVWRETIERLTAWLEARGLAPDPARELAESVVIVCALRHAQLSRDDALEAAIAQADRMR